MAIVPEPKKGPYQIVVVATDQGTETWVVRIDETGRTTRYAVIRGSR